MSSTDSSYRSTWSDEFEHASISTGSSDMYLPTYHEVDSIDQLPSGAVKIQMRHALQAMQPDYQPSILHGTLHGVVRTQIGKHIAQQKFLRAKCSFVSLNSSNTMSASLAIFDSSSELKCLPPPGVSTGTTWITEHTALSDRHMATGQCSVVYWVDFREMAGSKEVSRSRISVSRSIPIDLDAAPSSIQLTLATTKAKCRTGRLMQASVAGISKALRLSTMTQYPCPEVTFELGGGMKHQLQRFEDDCGTTQDLTIPLLVKVKLPRPTSNQHAMSLTVLRHRLLQRGVMGFGVFTANFSVKSRFGVGPAAKDHTVCKEDAEAVAEDTVLDLPPLYASDGEDGDVLATTTELSLTIPAHLLRQRTTDLELLRISHLLSLNIRTKQLDAELPALLPAYSARLVTDCCLE